MLNFLLEEEVVLAGLPPTLSMAEEQEKKR
jgi:hypothetical protein